MMDRANRRSLHGSGYLHILFLLTPFCPELNECELNILYFCSPLPSVSRGPRVALVPGYKPYLDPRYLGMIIPGRSLLARAIIRNVQSPPLQAQPCGVDLTLKRVMKWTSPGAIDLDNKLRQTAATEEIHFPTSQSLELAQGSYLVEFNETVSVPLDAMG